MSLTFFSNFEVEIDTAAAGSKCSGNTVNEIVLGFAYQGEIEKLRVLPPPGYVVPVAEAAQVFLQYIGDLWNYRTLVERGNTVTNNIFPIFYLNFPPSVENLVLYIYNRLAPVYKREYDVDLTYVEVNGSRFGAVYQV